MDQTSIRILVDKTALIFEQTRVLVRDSMELKTNALHLYCALADVYEDCERARRWRTTNAARRESSLPLGLSEMPLFDAEHAAKALIDEFGRRARIVAVKRGIACRVDGDLSGAKNWHDTFDAVMDIQEANKARSTGGGQKDDARVSRGVSPWS